MDDTSHSRRRTGSDHSAGADRRKDDFAARIARAELGRFHWDETRTRELERHFRAALRERDKRR